MKEPAASHSNELSEQAGCNHENRQLMGEGTHGRADGTVVVVYHYHCEDCGKAVWVEDETRMRRMNKKPQSYT